MSVPPGAGAFGFIGLELHYAGTLEVFADPDAVVARVLHYLIWTVR